MELTGSVMTLLMFLTYVTKQDHGVLLEVDVALKAHVPTKSSDSDLILLQQKNRSHFHIISHHRSQITGSQHLIL